LLDRDSIWATVRGGKRIALNPNKEPPMKLTRILVVAAAVMLPASWTLANAGEPAAPAGEKTEKATKSKKEGASGEKAPEGEKKAEKK
jgi:hypothetical protein